MIPFYFRLAVVLFDILVTSDAQHVVSFESSSLIHHGTFRNIDEKVLTTAGAKDELWYPLNGVRPQVVIQNCAI